MFLTVHILLDRSCFALLSLFLILNSLADACIRSRNPKKIKLLPGMVLFFHYFFILYMCKVFSEVMLNSNTSKAV